ncbi:MAG: hypothetical protein HYV13_04200 [Candidatus Doudnabacteria bacterium]|nr:hypothetical protein [Candidatus Doudnabacteria bacterium]
MLTQLLSSKPKGRLINLFLAHPNRSFALTQLRADSGMNTVLLAKTIKELRKIDFLSQTEKNRKKYYQVNKHFALYPELLSMLRKMKHSPADSMAKKAAKVGDCKLVVLTGVFAGHPRVETDVLFVGRVSGARLSKFLRFASKMAEAEVNYTVLTPQEFEYRKIMNDRFVKNILENNPVVVVDKTKNRSIAKLVYKL